MSITLYKATTYLSKIVTYTATRVTDKSYFTLDYQGREQRHSLIGDNFATFKTEQEAIEWIRNYLLTKKRKAYEHIASVGRELDEFNQKYPEK